MDAFLLKNSTIIFAFRLAGMGLAYGSIFLLTNNFGSEVYGRFSLAQTIFQFSVLLFSLGIPAWVLKNVADRRMFRMKRPLNNFLITGFYMTFTSGILGGLVMILLSETMALEWFNSPQLAPQIRIGGVLLFGAVLHQFMSEFLKARKQFVYFGLFHTFLSNFLFFLFLLIFIFLQWGESYLFHAYTSSFFLVGLIALLIFFPFKKSITNRSYSFSSVWKMSSPMMLSTMFIFLANWTDVIMLGIFVSDAEVGVYNAAYKLASISLLVITVVNSIVAPQISEAFSKNDIITMKAHVLKASRLIGLFTIPISLALIIGSKTILYVFGDNFTKGFLALTIISVGMLLNSITGPNGQVLNMSNHQKSYRDYIFITFLINLIGNYLLIKTYDLSIEGAAISSLISKITLNLLCLYKVKKEFGFWCSFPFKTVFRI